jgi:hypothetical protein
MKALLLAFSLIISCTVLCQNGTIISDTLILTNGLKFTKGSSINIGKGSKSDGGYAFLFTQPIKSGKQIVGPVQLTPGWSGYKMKIVDFQINGNEEMGKKYYLVLSTGNKLNYLCDPELAKEANEIF